MNRIGTHTPEPATERRPGLVAVDGRTYPLERVSVTATAEGGVAVTRLAQRFANPHDEALEVTYTLPLPADGVVLGYAIRVGDRVIRAEVEPRARAEADYRRALYEGKTAGLLEQDRADTFQQRLGNVPGRTWVEAEIEVLQPLAFVGGGAAPRWEYRFPTVVGARYEGAPGRVPDAGRLDPDRGAGGAIPARMEFELRAADARGAIESLEHEPVAAGEPGVVRLAGERLDRDVVMRWEACAEQVGVRIAEGPGLAGDAGRYALVTLTPPAVPGAKLARDLTVLVDASGSMDGWPLEAAKAAVRGLLRGLDPGDTFELLAFASRVRRLSPGTVRGDAEQVENALRALDSLRAGGATEMKDAVEEALAPLREGSQRQVVLVTDGYVGFEAEIVGHVTRRLPPGTRVHAVGIGSAPNRTLTSGVARAGHGVELLVGGPGREDEAGRRLCAATAAPVLTEVRVAGGAVVHVAPGRPRDVLAGQPALLTVELTKEGGTLEIHGRLSGEGSPWTQRIDVPPLGAGGGAVHATPLPLGALHGREVIADLELELAAGGREGLLESRIEERGMRHRIASRFTSLVAIAEEPSVDPRQPSRRERLPVELPAGVSAEGAGLVGCGAAVLFPKCATSTSISRLMPASALRSPRARTFPLVPVQIVRESDELLVVVFETSSPDFELPTGGVSVHARRRTIQATIVPELSSPHGLHEARVIMRLALRLGGGETWPAAGRVHLRWVDVRRMEPVDVELDLARAEKAGPR